LSIKSLIRIILFGNPVCVYKPRVCNFRYLETLSAKIRESGEVRRAGVGDTSLSCRE
jgi:hypothetical protein